MNIDDFEKWYAERQGQLGEPPFSCSHDAAQAAWNAAQEQHAAPALLTIGRTCVMCGHMNVWDVEQPAPALQIKGRTCVTCGHMKVWDVRQAEPRAPACRHSLLTIVKDTETGYCMNCKATGRMKFVVDAEPSEQPAAPATYTDILRDGGLDPRCHSDAQSAAPCARPEDTTVKLAGADYLDMLVDLDELRELLKEVAIAYAQEIGLPFEECNNELFRRVKKALEAREA
jgi:hypothetical protein